MITEIKSDEPISIDGILTTVEVEQQKFYNKALKEFINEIEKQTTFYCGKDSHIRKIAEQLKENL